MNMPTIEELQNENGSSHDSTLNSSPSPRSAGHSESESPLSQPVRKVTGFNKEPDPYILAQRARGDDKIEALNQDLETKNGGKSKSKIKIKSNTKSKSKARSGIAAALRISSSGSTRVNSLSESEDDETDHEHDHEHEEEEKRYEPLEEQMHFAQEFLDKQQEGYNRFDKRDNEDSEADLKSETPDTDHTHTSTTSNSNPSNKDNTPIHDIPLSVFSALSAVSMTMKQFETNDMIPNGNLTSLNAEPSIYESDTTEYQYHVDGDHGEYDDDDMMDGNTPKGGGRESDDSSMDNDDTIIAIMKMRQNLNVPMDDDGRARTNTSGSVSTVMSDDIV
eukprot:CAMPEP_0201571340 /NCGR_PEP_ID=MMETSP0190_2-20130828/14068_1 /ASSEMBLY_ACC=CAM_ASM_000263 /TAXON_ID=37353 /ORGANISM="Rosalina sp." /LENGTH=333 /DNA_ID=CAMNT_0047995885 /DNA_START=1 /DNA_END=1002 /DNA_ORIENTATION=-